ncbi:MAG TPA: hypothetical protein VK738_05350 [Terriglobales bacterium]|jgi:hypothetical protein|nr:hypothetical protein [Terriglobales bacterium]
MSFDARQFQLEMLKSLVEVGVDSYKENVRINSLLEDKAQKTAGLAGVFLAAALAFMKVDTLSVWPFNRLRILIPLSLAIVLLVCCVGFCLAVMWVRRLPGLPLFSSLNKLKTDLWTIESTALEAYEQGYWGDRAMLWQQVVTAQSPVITSKARWLLIAQIALASAMFVVAILLLFLIEPIVSSHL